jgi:hypothetical protein
MRRSLPLVLAVALLACAGEGKGGGGVGADAAADAAIDASLDAALDAGTDAPSDVSGNPADAGADVEVDAEAEAEAGASVGFCATSGWCWMNPLPQGNLLGTIWVDSASDVWLPDGIGTVMRFDGASLSESTGSSGFQITSIWGSDAKHVWGIATDANADVKIVYSDGTAWSDVQTSTVGLSAIWGSSVNDVWVAGNLGTVMHFNGTTWSTMPSGTQNPLLAVSGSGPNDVWFVGTLSTVLHYDGTTLAPPSSVPPSASLNDVWSSGPNDVWAVGTANTGTVDSIFHWNGTSWTGERTEQGVSVWGGATNDVWFVLGDGVTLLHYDGSTFTPTTFTGQRLAVVRGGASNDVWVGGYGGRLQSWDGTSWTVRSSGYLGNVNAAWSVGPEEWWGAAAGGTLVHWTNGTYALPAAVTTEDLFGLWGSSASDLWAVGLGGTILHYDGTSWSVSLSATTETLDAVWGSGPNDVYAAGQAGTVIHYDGAGWTKVTIGATGFLSAIWGSSGSDVWMAGEDPNFWHYNGTTWSPTATAYNIYGIGGTASNDVWAVGTGLLHFDGAAWTSVTSPLAPGSDFVSSVWSRATNDVWGACLSGTILHYDGTQWSTQPSPTDNPLEAVRGFAGASTMWALGWDGTALRHP